MARKRVAERIRLTNNEKLNVYMDCKNVCAHCGRHLQFYHDMTVDHVVPLNKGGRNEQRNYVALCEECNQAKSDDVVYPLDYYPYLPDKKRRDVQAVFDEYLENTPWFAYDNVFMLDRFDLATARAVHMPKQHCCYPVNATMRVEKTTPEDAFDYLQLYVARLQPEDKGLFVTSPLDLKTPYYKILDHGKCVMLITAYVDKEDGTDKNVLRVDFFPNPEIKVREHTTELTIAYILRSIVDHIHVTLMNTAKNTVIDMLVVSVQSDPIAKAGLKAYANLFKGMCAYFDTPTDDKDIRNGGTISVQMTLYQGTFDDISKLAQEHNVKSLKALAEVADKRALQKPLDEALSESRVYPSSKPKYVKHKNDAKRKSRKVKRK